MEYLIGFVISLLVYVGSSFLRSSPKVAKPDAATLDDIEMPRAEAGMPITYVKGTTGVSGSNVVDYGNLRTQAIKQSSGGGK